MGKKPRSRGRARKRQTPPRRYPWLWLVAGGALLLLVAAGALLVQPWSDDEPEATPQVVGAPRLSVERETVDEGYVKYDIPVRTTFHLSNVGDQPLRILAEPQVQLVQGC